MLLIVAALFILSSTYIQNQKLASTSQAATSGANLLCASSGSECSVGASCSGYNVNASCDYQFVGCTADNQNQVMRRTCLCDNQDCTQRTWHEAGQATGTECSLYQRCGATPTIGPTGCREPVDPAQVTFHLNRPLQAGESLTCSSTGTPGPNCVVHCPGNASSGSIAFHTGDTDAHISNLVCQCNDYHMACSYNGPSGTQSFDLGTMSIANSQNLTVQVNLSTTTPTLTPTATPVTGTPPTSTPTPTPGGCIPGQTFCYCPNGYPCNNSIACGTGKCNALNICETCSGGTSPTPTVTPTIPPATPTPSAAPGCYIGKSCGNNCGGDIAHCNECNGGWCSNGQCASCQPDNGCVQGQTCYCTKGQACPAPKTGESSYQTYACSNGTNGPGTCAKPDGWVRGGNYECLDCGVQATPTPGTPSPTPTTAPQTCVVSGQVLDIGLDRPASCPTVGGRTGDLYAGIDNIQVDLWGLAPNGQQVNMSVTSQIGGSYQHGAFYFHNVPLGGVYNVCVHALPTGYANFCNLYRDDGHSPFNTTCGKIDTSLHCAGMRLDLIYVAPTNTPVPTVILNTPTLTPTTKPGVTPTNTPIPTPTSTPKPTVTPLPTFTPVPTFTPAPKATSTPTPTPIPSATVTPTPIPRACGYTPCDDVTAPCQPGLKCMEATDRKKYCIMPQYENQCYYNPSIATCCYPPTPTMTPIPTPTPGTTIFYESQPTPTPIPPTYIAQNPTIVQQVTPTPTPSLPKAGVGLPWLAVVIPVGVLLLGLIL
jgi:hypothetical protein